MEPADQGEAQREGLRKEAARRSLRRDNDELFEECEVEFLVASGPGGQHRNKTETGVRLRHEPTGVVVSATERRSQSRNRERALDRLRERLELLAHVPIPRRPTKPTAGSRRRRVEGKRFLAAKKDARRPPGEE